MEWSNSQKEPTKNRINHGQRGGGKLQSTIATISTAEQLFPLPAGFLFPAIQILIHLNSF